MKKKDYKKRLEKEKREMRVLEMNDSNKNIKNGIIISVCVILFIFLMFAFTKIKTGEWDFFTRKNAVKYSAEVQQTKILCGQVLNRDNDEYFVLAYPLSDDTVSLYDSLLERYNGGENKLVLYKLDLSNSRNNICKADSLNLTNDVKTLKVVSPTLLRIKDSKIINSYTNYEDIKNTLLSFVD